MADLAVLRANDVSKAYGTSRKTAMRALDGVTVELRSGSSIGIIGESGSGKSTLARLLLGLSAPSAGSITFNGTDLRDIFQTKAQTLAFRRAVQFVGQDTTSSFDPLRTLRDAVRTPLQILCGLTRAAANERVDEVLGQLSLPVSLADRYPREVSGGQRQRFAIARAIAVEPQILLCDEVVSALDVSIQGSVLNLLKAYCRETGAGMGFVTHNLPAAGFIADELIVMYGGHVVEDGPTRQVIDHARHPFTAQLIRAYRAEREPAAERRDAAQLVGEGR